MKSTTWYLKLTVLRVDPQLGGDSAVGVTLRLELHMRAK